jgi:hypothetical protein
MLFKVWSDIFRDSNCPEVLSFRIGTPAKAMICDLTLPDLAK